MVQTRNVFEQCKIDLVLDAGANAGQYARDLRAFYKGEIISFEPVASTFDQLMKAASDDSHWKCYDYALGSQTATRPIRVFDVTQLSSFLSMSDAGKRMFSDSALTSTQQMVSVRRLEDVLEEIAPGRRNIFLKMDTQGFDVEVFKGLGDRALEVKALQSEVSVLPIYEEMPHWTESISIYERAGFAVAGLFPVKLDSVRVVEFDCLMVRS